MNKIAFNYPEFGVIENNADNPRFVIQNWMRTGSSIEFLGIWGILHNLDFNRVEYDTVTNQSGSIVIEQMGILTSENSRRLLGEGGQA